MNITISEVSEVREAMVMSAGLGTRMRPFTELCPKPFLPLMGIPLMQYVIDGLSLSGLKRAILNYHALPGDFLKKAAQLEVDGLSLSLSDESTKLLGSAGGIRKALDLFEGEAFFYVNADILLDLNLAELALHHTKLKRNFGSEVTLAVFKSAGNSEKYREIIYDPCSHQLTALGEHKVSSPFFVGAAVIEKSACRSIQQNTPCDFVAEILVPAIQRRRAGVFPCSGLWLDFGTPREWANGHYRFLEGLETGGFRSPLSRVWEKRVVGKNRRVGQRIWVSQRSQLLADPSWWEGPSYWDGLGAPPSKGEPLLKEGQICYGALEETELENSGWKGISFLGNRWESYDRDARKASKRP